MSESKWVFALYKGSQVFEGDGQQYFITGEAYDLFEDGCNGAFTTDDNDNQFCLYYRLRVEGTVVKEVEMLR